MLLSIESEMPVRHVVTWFISGVAFSAGIFTVAYIYDKQFGTSMDREGFSKTDLVGKFEIVEIAPAKSEDRLAFNALVKNYSEHKFTYAWFRVELYDFDGNFIDSCDTTTGNFEPDSKRWIQIECSVPGYGFEPEYDSIQYGIMEARANDA